MWFELQRQAEFTPTPNVKVQGFRVLGSYVFFARKDQAWDDPGVKVQGECLSFFFLLLLLNSSYFKAYSITGCG